MTLEYQVHGIEDPLLKNVSSRLKAAQLRYRKKLTEADIHRLFKQAPENIRLALQPYGYFHSRIDANLVQQSDELWVANFAIDKGRPVVITHVNLNLTGHGEKDVIIHKFIKRFPLHEGDIFESEAYESAKSDLFDVVDRRGFIKAEWRKHQVTLDLKNHTSKLDFELETGPRYYFGDVRFGKSHLSEKLLKRYVHFKRGDTYSTAELLVLQDHLNASNYFKRVSVHPQRDQAEDFLIPIDINLLPQKTRQYTFGGGFGTDTGPRASAGWENIPVNRFGHKFHALARVSKIRNNAVMQYIIPGKYPSTDYFTLAAGFHTNEFNNGNSQTVETSVSYVSKRGHWENTVALKYFNELFDVERESRERTELILPSINWTRIKADDLINTNHGSKISLSMLGGSSFGGKTEFLQTNLKAEYITSLTSDDRLKFRAELGYTYVHNLDSMPLSLRFFAGGAQSIRGYGYQHLGPGRYLSVASAEYQHRLWKELYGTIFYDVGNAFDHFFHERLREGVGFGLMYRSPIGPLHLTLAWAISEPRFHHKRVEFSMGPDLQ